MSSDETAEANGSRAARLWARALSALARVPPAVLLLIAIGALLRAVLAIGYEPAVLAFQDSATYINMANFEMFWDPARTVGYSIFLEIAHAISPTVATVINLQHLLGIATGLLLYAAVRRLGAPVWVALIGAAAVILSLDQIYLEHAFASETVFTFAIACAAYAAVRSLEPGRPLGRLVTTRTVWLLAAGLALGASAWVRAAGAPMIPFLALWVVLAIPGRWYWRLARGALAATPAVALLLVYFILNNAATGTFGLIQSGGWGMYSRTAKFADCTKFDPPPGTEALCETTPPEDRGSPDFYSWNPESPAQRVFGYPPAGNDKLGEFGMAAAKSQPFEYAKAVGKDFLHYFAPGTIVGPAVGDYELLRIDQRDEVSEENTRVTFGGVNAYYEDVGPVTTTGVVDALTDAQQVLRVHPSLFILSALLAAVGVWFARGAVRAGIFLFAGSGILLLAISAANTYNARYAIPADGVLVAGGALGLWVVINRYRERSATTSENASA
jgi:hypothetical protein